MRRIKQRKIIFRLIIGILVLVAGLMVEFVVYRYRSNRSTVFRVEAGVLQAYRSRKWQEFAVQGVSRKAGDEAGIAKREYALWFKEMAAGNVNVIRVNTILPPQFYRAFFEYNMLSNKPLYLLQGVVNPGIRLSQNNSGLSQNAFDEELTSGFFEEIRHTVDVIHGKAVLNHVTYSLNVAPYVMGYILGEDMDANFVISTNERNTHVIGFEGDYLYTANASPYEAWLAGVGNYLISYEQQKYGGALKLVSWTDRPDVDTERVNPTEKFNSGLIAWRNEWFKETWEDT